MAISVTTSDQYNLSVVLNDGNTVNLTTSATSVAVSQASPINVTVSSKGPKGDPGTGGTGGAGVSSVNELDGDITIIEGSDNVTVTNGEDGTISIAVTDEDNWTLSGNDIYSNNSGGVGIGTETPSQKLHVVGQMNLSDSGSNVMVGSNNSALTTGGDNTAIGYQTLKVLTEGNDNTAVGHQSLLKLTTGDYNAAVGSGSLSESTTGNYNTAVGADSLKELDTGQNNTALGYNAGSLLNASSSWNTAVGATALHDFLNTSSRQNNTAVGGGALYGISGSDNVGIGVNSAMLGKSRNTAVGSYALQKPTASENTGDFSNNVALGWEAGKDIVGDNNVLIGYRAGKNLNGSNKLYIESLESTSPLIYGEFDNDLVKINGKLSIGDGTSIPSSMETLSGQDISDDESTGVFKFLVKDTSVDGNPVKEMTFIEVVRALLFSGINSYVDTTGSNIEQFQSGGLTGDFDGDGGVGIEDLLAFLAQFGQSVFDEGFYLPRQINIEEAPNTSISGDPAVLDFESAQTSVSASGTAFTEIDYTNNKIIFRDGESTILSAYPNKRIRISGWSSSSSKQFAYTAPIDGESVKFYIKISVYDSSGDLLGEELYLHSQGPSDPGSEVQVGLNEIRNYPVSDIHGSEADISKIEVSFYAETVYNTDVDARIKDLEIKLLSGNG